ncbi:MAG TPA: 4Fe-4S binding protein [Symbiobacteriaceae bacterium]|jgi:ferredoxin
MVSLDQLLTLVDPAPMVIDARACLRARHRGAACRECGTACPEGAITFPSGTGGPAVDPGLCTRCGICAGVCRTAAVDVRGIDGDAVLSASEIRCAEAAGAGAQLPCLGWLGPDRLLALAARHPVVRLTAGDCGRCRYREGGRRAAAATQAAAAALAALGSPNQFEWRQEDARSGAGGPPVSRRDLLRLWQAQGLQVARQLLPKAQVNPARLPAQVPPARRYWVARTRPDVAGAMMPEGPWKSRTASDACTGCGLCVALCPTGALTQAQEQAEWTLRHQPSACVGCDTCADFCPVRAVGEEPVPVAAMAGGTVRPITRRTVSICPSCRKEFKGKPGAQRCPLCSLVPGEGTAGDAVALR